MRRAGVLGAILLTVQAGPTLACTPKDPALIVDLPLQIGAQCDYINAGRDDYYDAYTGRPVIDLGRGKIAQVRGFNQSCTTQEELIVADCNTAEVITIAGVPPPERREYVGESTFVKHLQRYGDGPIALSARSTVAELAAISRREGFEHTLDPLGLSDQGPRNRVSPFCGCKLIYPATLGATR